MVRRTRALTVLAALFALVLAFWTPAAMAHHKDDHSKGGGHNGSEGTVTEDDDDDGHPNSPDPEGDADNQHPSGKDKHEESGGSGNQGKAQSDPDDDGRGPDRSNGGVDQPGGSGGDDQLDQDGNNGCGNDDDFEDDNEGWCGKPDDRVGGSSQDKNPTDVCDADETMPGIQKCEEVKGEVIEDEGDDDVEADVEEKSARPADDEDQNAVLGIRVTAAPSVAAAPAVAAAAVSGAPEAEGAVLPFTGPSDLVIFVGIALMLIGSGVLALRGRRSNA